jgi:tetraacyldisaccharide 4'-kinase
MTPPRFWQTGGLLPTALAPFGAITAAITARRVARAGWRAPVPVICVGNAGVGGSGKTPVVLDLAARLTRRGVAVHCLTRGYGGSARGVTRVDPTGHTAAEVGDEALLLAAVAPTWVGADRGASGRAAVAAGAQALLMDDGLQNPTLEKTVSLLVIDGGAGFGNGRLLPAGPLREPVARAAARCRAAVMIGADQRGAAAALPADLPILQASLAPGPDMLAQAGRVALAFAGIARPGKFFATLEQAGMVLAESRGFADHHSYSARELANLRLRAGALGAVLVTTWKDFVRIPPHARGGILPMSARLAWGRESAVDALLAAIVPGPNT